MKLKFNQDGLLDKDYQLTLDELKASVLVSKFPISIDKNIAIRWRLYLVNQFESLLKQLWGECGYIPVWINGSFVTNKAHPGDIDGYFEIEHFSDWKLKHLPQLLLADPVWNINNRAQDPNDLTILKPIMWIKHKIELFPVFNDIPRDMRTAGQHPITKKNLSFEELFRIVKYTGEPKGIIKICP